MLRIFVRRSEDVRYFTDDAALEIDTLRPGAAGWWLRGRGDPMEPGDVSRVFTTTARSRVVGYDLVFAAPRPLSILLAIEPDHGRRVIDAQRESVRAAMTYLEEYALVVRDRRGHGDEERSARWESVVGFTHGVNRHGEPHLHDHVLVGARPGGESVVVDSRSLFAHARAADALYRSTLRFEIARSTPFRPFRSFASGDVVEGIDEGYRTLWGGRYNERGLKVMWSREAIVEKWRDDLRRFEPLGIVARSQHNTLTLHEHTFGSVLEGRYSVGRRHLIEAWANAATFGQLARDVGRSVDVLFPQLRDSRGVREPTISVAEARQIAAVRERGARPLTADELVEWRYRSRDLSRDARSR